jgi:putative sterol carrier protein
MEPTGTTVSQNQSPTPSSSRHSVDALAGLSGRMRLEVDGKPSGVLDLHSGEVELKPDDGRPVDATVACVRDNEEYARRMLEGKLSPVVAMLRGRYEIRGNAPFAMRVLLAIQGSA